MVLISLCCSAVRHAARAAAAVLTIAVVPAVLCAQSEALPAPAPLWIISGGAHLNLPMSSGLTSEDLDDGYPDPRPGSPALYLDYPFREPDRAWGAGLRLGRRLGQAALVASVSADVFQERGRQGDEATLEFWTIGIGAEYYVLPVERRLNFLIGAGITSSIIRSSYRVNSFGTIHSLQRQPAGRIGLRGEFGARYAFAASPLALDLALGYHAANLVGKSWAPGQGESPELNDGAPDHGGDAIAMNYVTVRLAMGYRF